MLRVLVWGLDSPIAAPVVWKLHDEGVFCVKTWIVNVSEMQKPYFAQRDGIEIIEDKFSLDFRPDETDAPPVWLDTKVRSYVPIILQNFTRETYYYRSPVYEYMNVIQLWIRYFYTLLTRNKMEAVIFADIPHGGFMCVLYAVARALNMRTLIFVPVGPFGTTGFCFSIEDYGRFADVPAYRMPQPKEAKIQQGYKKELYYMEGKHAPQQMRSLHSRWKALGSPGEFIRRRKSLLERSIQKYSSIREFLSKKIVMSVMDTIEKRQYNENVVRYTEKDIDLTRCYVYFPLHLQPEMTTDTLGGIYSDQILAIEKLRAMLPPDWLIYVKENPKQSKFMRQEYFYKRLKLIPHTVYVDRSIDTYELMEHAQFVATITGTAGWEAISGGRNVVIFGQSWYESFPGVFRYREDLCLEEITSYQINHTSLEQAFSRYLEKTMDAVFLTDIQEAMSDFNAEENGERLEKFFRFVISYMKEHPLAVTMGERE